MSAHKGARLSCLNIYFLPVAASWTLTLPFTTSATTFWMSEKSWKTVKGTFSLSQ